MFENRVQREVYGPQTGAITREWRRLHNKGLYDLYFSTNIIQVIKPRMRWTEQVAHMRGRKVIQGFGG